MTDPPHGVPRPGRTDPPEGVPRTGRTDPPQGVPRTGSTAPGRGAHDADERRALVVSIAASAAVGGAAVVWGVLADSGVLVFDGVFLLAGILLSGVSLAAARAAAAPPTVEYPFGKHAVTPLAVALQGAALLGTIAYAAADAVTTLLAGGSDASPTTMLLYGLASAAVSLGVVAWLRRTRGSDLVDAEVAQWRAGAVLSAVVGVGGAAALALDAAGATGATRYADPVLLLVACAVILPVPFGLLRAASRELLEAAPSGPVAAALAAAVADVRDRFGLPEPVVRATKLGRRLYVEVDFVVEPGTWDVDAEDRVRRAVVDALRALDGDVWATVEVTADPGSAA